jgi:hypothetical protein
MMANDTCLIEPNFDPEPRNTVARGSFPHGYTPSGSVSVPVRR